MNDQLPSRELTTAERLREWADSNMRGKYGPGLLRIAADELEQLKPAHEPPAAPANAFRYKVQQDQGEYCLKICDDGDLVDWSSYEALLRRLTPPPGDALYRTKCSGFEIYRGKYKTLTLDVPMDWKLTTGEEWEIRRATATKNSGQS
jgi:hypothetical protein